MAGVVGAFVGREAAERRSDQVADLLKAARPHGAEERFQFSEGGFDRIEVGTVGLEESEVPYDPLALPGAEADARRLLRAAAQLSR